MGTYNQMRILDFSDGFASAVQPTTIGVIAGDVANTPAGNIAATNVQSAINELDTEKQPIDADLTAIAGLASSGIIARTGAGTASVRTIVAGSNKLAVTNGDGVSGNPSIDVTESNLSLTNMGGLVGLTQGGTGQITANASLNALLPSQTGNADKVLVTDGTNTSWDNASGGSGGVNYLEPYFVGDDITGINTYNDGASAVPVDGTGGTATGLSTTVNLVSPLGEDANIRFSKDASNRQGCGWSTDFIVQSADYGGSRPLIQTFMYKVSAAYVSGDIRVFAYDKDNGTLLNVMSLTGDGSINHSLTGAGYTGSFNLVSTANDYRLIFHITSTNASAWDFDCVRLSASPQQTVQGFIGGYLGAETWTDNWANTTTSVKIWRRGSRVKVRGIATLTGVPTSSNFGVTIPAAYTVASGETGVGRGDIQGQLVDTGTDLFPIIAYFDTTTSITFRASNAAGAAVNTLAMTTSAPFTWATGDTIEFNAEWEVVGWDESAALSTTDTTLMGAYASYSGDAASATSGNPIIVPTKRWDMLNNYNNSTGLFTVPRTAKYKVYGSALSAGTPGTTIRAYVNGVNTIALGSLDSNGEVTFSGAVEANAGDTISIRPDATFDATSIILHIEEWFNPTVFSVYNASRIVESNVAMVATGLGANVWGDIASISLTPGTWDTFLFCAGKVGGGGSATVNAGIGTVSGNNSPGTVGVDYIPASNAAGFETPVSIGKANITVTVTTTYYFKFMSNAIGAQAGGRFWARKIS
jgi:hypothetical protein